MALKTIRMELARSAEFPAGSVERGYEFKAPLTADGHLDAESWPTYRDECRVRRFWHFEADKIGELLHTRGRKWVFSYEPGEEDDEALYRLDAHVFKVGEYVTVTEPEGDLHTFRIVSVK